MKRAIVLTAVMAAGVLAMAVAQHAELSPLALEATKIERIRDRLYVITGSDRTPIEAFSGGNTAVFVTDSGVVLVDTKLPGWGREILDRVRTVTDKPVTTIINTHTHGDHTGSNEFFAAPSVDIIAHENTKTNMSRMGLFKRNGGKGLPTTTFEDRLTLGAGADRIDLYYFGRGHTSGDTWVVFPALRVMHAGDMFARKDAPTLDRANGGSGLEFARTIDRALATVRDIDTVIPGHGPLRTIPELDEYRRFMTDFVAASREALEAGKSAEEAARSIDLHAKYANYTSARYRAAIQAIYDELRQARSRQ
jgi:glyoxylase-like metal-dependent hydrolase (beta-lactamase superfamily II)